MRDISERILILENKIKVLLESGETQVSLQLTNEITEILSTVVAYHHKEKQKAEEEKTLTFIEKRLESIKNDATPIRINPGAKAIIHIIPTSNFEEDSNFEISVLKDRAYQLPQLGETGYDYRFNFDGFLTYNRSDYRSSYVQVFRNGCMEIVDTGIINDSKKSIYITRFEDVVIHTLPKYLKVLEECKIGGPYSVYITFLEVKEHALYHGTFFQTHQIEKDELRLPKIIFEENDKNIALSLKPAFDVLWNSGGFPGSINYIDGNRKPRN